MSEYLKIVKRRHYTFFCKNISSSVGCFAFNKVRFAKKKKQKPKVSNVVLIDLEIAEVFFFFMYHKKTAFTRSKWNVWITRLVLYTDGVNTNVFIETIETAKLRKCIIAIYKPTVRDGGWGRELSAPARIITAADCGTIMDACTINPTPFGQTQTCEKKKRKEKNARV